MGNGETQRHQSEEIKILNSFPRMGIEPTTSRVYSHTLVPLPHGMDVSILTLHTFFLFTITIAYPIPNNNEQTSFYSNQLKKHNLIHLLE